MEITKIKDKVTGAVYDLRDSTKQPKETGKGLSTNDYTDADKAKVNSVTDLAQKMGEIDTASRETITQDEVVFGDNYGNAEYAKVGNYGVKAKKFMNLDGNDIVPSIDSSMPDSPTDTTIPSTKLVKDYLSDKLNNIPMSTVTNTDELNKIVIKDDSNNTILEITNDGIKTKSVTDLDGNRISSSKSLKVLHFGNSFTEDSISYVPAMLKNIAPSLDFSIGIAFIGGSPLAQHCANFTGVEQSVGGSTYQVTDYSYRKYTNAASKWINKGTKNVDSLLADEDWDIITFQQNGSTAFTDWDTYYAPFIHKIHKALFSKLSNKTIKLGWLLTHGTYSNDAPTQLTRWNGTMLNAKNVLDKTSTEIVFPYGTAIQNLRTTPLNTMGADGGVGFVTGNTTSGTMDNAHLHEGIGTMCANYANVLVMLQSAGMLNLSILGEKTRVTKAWNTSNGTMSPNYGASDSVENVTDDNVYLAQVAAIMAVKYPYEVCTWDGNSFVHNKQ